MVPLELATPPGAAQQDLCLPSQPHQASMITTRPPAPTQAHVEATHCSDGRTPGLNHLHNLYSPLHQSGFNTPGMVSTIDPFIHVHFPSQPLAHVQASFILQTPRRLDFMTTPIRSYIPEPSITLDSPPPPARICRGLEAVEELSDDDDGSDSDPPQRQAPPRKSKANDVWTFFRSN